MTTKTTDLPHKVKPTTTEHVTFRDGMVVTAEDLDAAMRYPASMLHTVLRSYFGCGVVCGLDLEGKLGEDGEPRWMVCITEGLAFDCDGYPLELCGPVNLDLSPDACGVPIKGDVFIAIRRATHDDASSNACSCDSSGPHRKCSRARDHVIVKAFSREDMESMKSSLCKRPEVDQPGTVTKAQGSSTTVVKDPEEKTELQKLCACLTACSDCACTGESWIFLGYVTLKEDTGLHAFKVDERKFVKPIECLCGKDAALAELAERVKKLEDGPTEDPPDPAETKKK